MFIDAIIHYYLRKSQNLKFTNIKELLPTIIANTANIKIT